MTARRGPSREAPPPQPLSLGLQRPPAPARASIPRRSTAHASRKQTSSRHHKTHKSRRAKKPFSPDHNSTPSVPRALRNPHRRRRRQASRDTTVPQHRLPRHLSVHHTVISASRASWWEGRVGGGMPLPVTGTLRRVRPS